jgi:hypothetical protein
MVARLVATAVAACVLAVGAVGTVFAAGARDVTITVTSINGVETFTTSGGVLCDRGTSENVFEKFGGSGSSRAGSFHGYKILTCENGRDTFTITYDAATVFGSPTDQGGWHLVGGTGTYAGYSGGGRLVGTYVPGGIIDSYLGRVSTN